MNRRKPRVAVVVPKYGLVGGGERFVLEVTERIAQTGRFEIHVFANRWRAAEGSPVMFHKVPLIRFPRFLRPLSFAWSAKRLIRREAFDLVHSHDRIFRADVASLHCVPHAGWVRDIRRKRPSLFDHAQIAVERRMMASGADTEFLPVSNLAMDTFRQAYGDPLPGRWTVVPPGVDADRFGAPDRGACRAEIRARHGIGESEFLLLFVGMNFEVKGLGAIISAVAKAGRERPEAGVKLLVVGRGDEEKYRQLARSLGAEDAVRFAGTVTGGLERYYRAADLFAMLSGFDTFGMVVLEAMAAGLPVVVSPMVGAKDLVEEGANGFVTASPDDDATLTRAIGLLADPETRIRMGDAAQQTARGCGWDRVAERTVAAYERTLSMKGETTP